MVRNREPLQVWEEDFPTTTGDTSSAGMLALALEERKKETTFFYGVLCLLGFPGGSVVKNPSANAGDISWIAVSGRAPEVGNGNSL